MNKFQYPDTKLDKKQKNSTNECTSFKSMYLPTLQPTNKLKSVNDKIWESEYADDSAVLITFVKETYAIHKEIKCHKGNNRMKI